MKTKNNREKIVSGFKWLLQRAAIVLAVFTVAFIVGFFMDGANNTYLGPSWEYVLESGAASAWAEKLFICAAVGFMMSIIPGGLIVLLTCAIYSVFKDSITEAESFRDMFTPLLEEMDIDGDGVFSDRDMLLAYQAAGDNRALLAELIKVRFWVGSFDQLADGSSAVSIDARDLASYPDQVREKRNTAFTVLFGTLVIAVLLFIMNQWAPLIIGILANVVLWHRSLRKKVQLQKFVLREFDRMDKGGDGVADEFELVQLYHELAPNERDNILAVLKHVGSMGHEIQTEFGLSIRAISKTDAETYAPEFARAIA